MQLTQPELEDGGGVCVCVCSIRVTCGYSACMASLGLTSRITSRVCVCAWACIHKCIDAMLFWFLSLLCRFALLSRVFEDGSLLDEALVDSLLVAYLHQSNCTYPDDGDLQSSASRSSTLTA